MKNTKKKTTKPKRNKQPNKMSEGELKRTHTKYMKNFVYGMRQIIELPEETQIYLWGVVLQQTLYNQTTNPYWNEMYNYNLYPYEVGMNDEKLLPLIKKRLEGSLEELITSGSRRKFVGVLNSIHKSYEQGEYV